MFYWTRLERLARDKHSNLLGISVSYKESKVLWIQSLIYKTFIMVTNGCTKQAIIVKIVVDYNATVVSYSRNFLLYWPRGLRDKAKMENYCMKLQTDHKMAPLIFRSIPFLMFKLCHLSEWGSVTHQMAVPVPSISCCVLNHHDLFYQIQNALDFNRDTCCHLALC